MIEFLRQLRARPFLAGELLVASFFVNLLGLGSSIYVIQVLNRYVANGIDATLATLTLGVLIAVALEFGFRNVRLKMAQGINAKPNARLSTSVFSALTSVRAQALDRLPPTIRREITGAINTVQQAYSPNNLTTIMDVPFALLFVAVLFMLNATIAVTVSCFLTFVFLFSLISHRLLKKPIEEMGKANARSGVLMGGALQASDSVRAFNAALFLRTTWAEHQQKTVQLARQVLVKQGFSQAFTQSLGALMSVTVIALGALQAVSGEMDVGLMIGANILAGRALAPITKFSQLGAAFAKAAQSLEILGQFAKMPVERTRGTALKAYQGRLEFKDLGFAHHKAPGPLFESLSLKVEPGQILAVVGGNGSGKTTLARLLMGLLEPSRGQILVDGIEMEQAVPEWWRRQVIYLPQEPTFFNGTLRDNLTTANPEITEEQLNQIITAAGLRKWFSESAEGLETPVFNGGSNLALGIRRRLALARALSTDGMLALFDEPTEGMDAEGRNAVFNAIRSLAKRGRTIILFSHDPNMVKNAALAIDLNEKPVPKIVVNSKRATPAGEAEA